MHRSKRLVELVPMSTRCLLDVHMRTSKTWQGMEVERRGGSVSVGVEAGGSEDFSHAVESMFWRMMQVMFDLGL